ncbi:hypothetical protein [Brucella endophytica]|uniref:hypothetical protein n=1 Tax=Brucella endophytica TaxID=1963359 RepID=UPI001662B3DE|nr:hypothetical protein [Brucella endophytica]
MSYSIKWTAAFPDSFETRGWRPPEQLLSATSTAGPALLEFNKQLWCVHNDGIASGARMWSAVFDGTAWQAENPIDNNYTHSRPALAVFKPEGQDKEQLWCAYQGLNGYPFFLTSDNGQDWVGAPTIDAPLASGPAIATFGNKLYYVYQGPTSGIGGDINMWYSWNAGQGWQTPSNVGTNSTSASLSLATSKTRLTCFYRSSMPVQWLYAASNSGQGWTTPSAWDGQIAWGDATDAGPALCYLPSRDMLLGIYGAGGGFDEGYTELHYITTTGNSNSWSSPQTIKGVSRALGTGVGLAMYNGVIFLAYCAAD